MSDVPGGELKFKYLSALPEWLATQPREVSVVIAARVALRVAPTMCDGVARLGAMQFADLAFPTFWASSVAWVAAKYPTRANEIRAAYAVAAASAVSFVAEAAHAAAAAARAAFAATAEAASASAADTYRAALRAATIDDMLASITADANRLRTAAPDVLAGEPLWLLATPEWAQRSFIELSNMLGGSHWQPWLDWYERRLNGREAAEEIELLFETLLVDPRERDPAEQNAALAAEIERLSHHSPQRSGFRDFFISYSAKDEAEARDIVGVLEGEGYSTFAQFKDIQPGHNFVREMQRGLEGARGLVAVLSPEYEAADHCQAEWAFAYNRDPGGAARKIVPFLVRETKPNALASQLVYRKLIGLSGEERKRAILAAVAARPLPAPAENVSAPFTFGWSATHRVGIVAGPLNTPVFPHVGSDRDHRERLDACRKTAARLAKDLAAQRFNVRNAYRETLERFLEDLPTEPGSGNFLMADCEARTLRGLFEEDAAFLPRELGERLNRVLEFAISLRPFYEGVGHFYDDVKTGRLALPLPKDAVAGFIAVVREHTPEVFEDEVSKGAEKIERDFPEERPPAPPPPDGVLKPRADPIEAPDPKKAHDYALGSTVNAIYATFLKGRDIAIAVGGWSEIAQKLGEHAGPVIEFLKASVARG